MFLISLAGTSYLVDLNLTISVKIHQLQNLNFLSNFLLVLYPAACKCFLVFNAVFVRWSNIIP